MMAYFKKYFSQIIIYNYDDGLVFEHRLCKITPTTLKKTLQIIHIIKQAAVKCVSQEICLNSLDSHLPNLVAQKLPRRIELIQEKNNLFFLNHISPVLNMYKPSTRTKLMFPPNFYAFLKQSKGQGSHDKGEQC